MWFSPERSRLWGQIYSHSCQTFESNHCDFRRNTVKKKLLLLTIAVLCLASFASADTFTTFATRAQQNPTDIYDWSQLGPAFTVFNTPVGVTSFNSLNATLDIGGGLQGARLDDFTGGWNGNFEPGETLVWTQGNGN